MRDIVRAVIVLLVVKQRNKQHQSGVPGQLVPCPHCAELVQMLANVCRFCGADLGSPDP